MAGDPEMIADALVRAIAPNQQDVAVFVREVQSPVGNCNWEAFTGIPLLPDVAARFDQAITKARAGYPQLDWQKTTERDSGRRIVSRWVSA